MSGMEAVAWVTNADVRDFGCGDGESVFLFAKSGKWNVPLYSQATVDTLRAQLEAAEAEKREAWAAVESKAGWEWKKRAEAAEKELRAFRLHVASVGCEYRQLYEGEEGDYLVNVRAKAAEAYAARIKAAVGVQAERLVPIAQTMFDGSGELWSIRAQLVLIKNSVGNKAATTWPTSAAQTLASPAPKRRRIMSNETMTDAQKLADEYRPSMSLEVLHSWAEEAVSRLRSEAELLEALQALFADYKRLADSGDAGFWRLEGTDVGQQAMRAIANATQQRKEPGA